MIRALFVAIFFAAARISSAAPVTPPSTPAAPPNPYFDNPLKFVADFYDFALAIGGLLAFGMIVYAGVRYALARGSSSEVSDAKDRITQALIGLVLLLSVFMILRVVNPELLRLSLPGLKAVTGPLPPGTPGANTCNPRCSTTSTPPTFCVQGSCQANVCPAECPGGPCAWNYETGKATCASGPASPAQCVVGNERFLCGDPLAKCLTPCAVGQSCEYTQAGTGYYFCK